MKVWASPQTRSMGVLVLTMILTMHEIHFSFGSSVGKPLGLPAHHPPVVQGSPTTRRGRRSRNPTLARFRSNFRCPYANEWLTKGPQQAAIDLGLVTDTVHNHKRSLQETSTEAVRGSCSYTSPWTGNSCFEFRGQGWSEASMDKRCSTESSSIFMMASGCPQPEELAGWCVKDVSNGNDMAMEEASSMMITAMSDCDGNQMACQTFVGGTFVAATRCGGADDENEKDIPFDYAGMGPPSGPDKSCMIAPGAIGAAHQSGFSEGYDTKCKGTPAEGSPYMWPMAWLADVDTQQLAYGYDEVVNHMKGRVFYRLDKNWKRLDSTYAKGVLRTIGQGPCDEEDQLGMFECAQDMDITAGDAMETMIHKGSKMYFITWKSGEDLEVDTHVQVGETDVSLIAECKYMDLMVIGNIRPDWFLDDRGDDTDVQYLGDQHVYYASTVPRLVKQWRKKDFASQYFTMSMAGNPPHYNTQNSTEKDTDTIHWPLILNIPGEGFGDDMLQYYTNHKLLSDADDSIFTLVEALEASGGSCPLMERDGDDEASFGPPILEEHIPSNLEVDENAWFTNVYTFSPVWQQPPPPSAKDTSMTSDAVGVALTEKDRVKVESCYHPSTKSVQLSVEFTEVVGDDEEELPWMAIGYRANDICAMTPIAGGDTKVIMVLHHDDYDVEDENGFPNKAYVGTMGAATKSFRPEAIDSIYASLHPLDQTKAMTMGYSNVNVQTRAITTEAVSQSRARTSSSSRSSVVLSFHQEFDEKPKVMHLMYAIGSSPELGFHASRSCFEVTEFPTCTPPPTSSLSLGTSPPSNDEEADVSASTMTSPWLSGRSVTVGAGMIVLVGWVVLAF